MKHLFCFVWMSVALCLSSCIDEYNELPVGSDIQRLVVDGQIVSGSKCRFSLRHTSQLSQPDEVLEPVTGATIVVMAEGKEQEDPNCNYSELLDNAPEEVLALHGYYVATEESDNPGHYNVNVGVLDSKTKYYAYITHPEFGTYRSEAQYPLDAPEIEGLGFTGGNATSIVTIWVSTANLTERTYLMWDYEEYWKIVTPYTTSWEYSVENHGFQKLTYDPHIGWDCSLYNFSVVGNNADYGDGQILKKPLYEQPRDDLRFTTRYATRVRQMAITQEEYEYHKLVKQQTTEMGGLFTPMPADLPSNVYRSDGVKAVGYIGVRGHVANMDLFLNRLDVGCTRRDYVRTVPEDMADTPEVMVLQGYRVYDYTAGKAKWVKDWGVDCRMPYWGTATLDKPDFWID